ncbi:hypothetical protein HPB49_026249 [Dermacentor silvarum]|nr:hypothetical protein HPB49_026249 [Dermacentor silvarum]
MQAYYTMGGQVSLIVNICPAMSMLEESLNAMRSSAVAIEVLPHLLELRHRCREAVRRLTERWHLAIGGEEFHAAAIAPNPGDGAEASVAFNRDDAEELCETVDALEQELEDTRDKFRCVFI